MMKRVAINTRFLLANKLEGFGWFTYHTSKYLVLNNPDIEFYFLFDRGYDERYVFAGNVKPVVLFPQARHPILFKWWFDYSVIRFLEKEKIDLFISPDGYLSLKTSVPQLAVIHDLNFEHYPEDIKPHHSRYLRKYFPKFAQKAQHIVTVSEFSKNDIHKTYNVPLKKISVAYNGVHPEFTPAIAQNADHGVPYFLFVGSIHPRKNLKRLLHAFDAFKSQTAGEHQLWIVGDPYYWSKEMKQTLEGMKFRDEVVFYPYASLVELVSFYQNALALMFVSYFEGFGIPVVEAMACGCPVVVGENTACDEIAGGAALTVDPFNVDAIAGAMVQLVSDESLRHFLIAQGLDRSKQFSWDQTGSVMNRVMHELLNA